VLAQRGSHHNLSLLGRVMSGWIKAPLQPGALEGLLIDMGFWDDVEGLSMRWEMEAKHDDRRRRSDSKIKYPYGGRGQQVGKSLDATQRNALNEIQKEGEA